MRLKDRIQAIHKEIMLLILLCIAIVPMLFFTRAMATRNRAMHARIATIWYQEGKESFQAGDFKAAIGFFRNATTYDHANEEYSLALARALAGENNAPEARPTLLKLRESSPENGEINLDLARLTAKMGDVPDAVRYYQNALYGVWPDKEKELDQRRRAVRAELVELLLQHGESTSALSELLILSRDIPDTASEHVRIGQLFLKAQDPARSLDHFMRALRLDRSNADALVGAGQSAFDLGKYSVTVRYLDVAFRLGMRSEASTHLLDISKHVLADDPLAATIGVDDRARRLLRGFARAEKRLTACLEGRPAGYTPVSPVLSALQSEAESLRPNLIVGRIRRDPELIRTGFESHLPYRDGRCRLLR